jgi:hypothetical protein
MSSNFYDLPIVASLILPLPSLIVVPAPLAFPLKTFLSKLRFGTFDECS